jgi:hypothetical protein
VHVEEAEQVIRRLQKRYEESPEEDWRILMGRDSSGRLTQLIGDSNESWQIKGEMVSPMRFAGVGLKLEGIDDTGLFDVGEPFYGLRPMDKDSLTRILRGGGVRGMKDLASLPRTPLTQAISSEAVVEGPVFRSLGPIAPVSEKQKRLEVTLNRGLENLLRKKHPETRYSYG